MKITDIFRLLRPLQYCKNILILFPLLFSDHPLTADALIRIFLAMAAFSFLTSAVYIYNDLADRSIRLLAVQPGWMRTDMGGQNADLDPYDAAAQLVRLFGEMDRTDREPLFVGNDGTQIPW